MKKNVKKNSFEKLCDKLEADYVFNNNEITYVRNYFMRNKMDKDTLLKIKAEAIADDYYSFNAMKISIVTLIFSSIAITIDIILQNINSIVSSIGCILCICIGMFAVVKFLGTNEWDSVVRWRKYVLIVVDELLDKKKKK